MTGRADTVAGWWSMPPAGQVSYLVDADPELLTIDLDPLPPEAPAVVRYVPGAGGPFSDQLTVLLRELDRAALGLFPRWLPGAERLDGSVSLAVPAVRELASRNAARSHNFGPFLADLAQRALCGNGERVRFPAEVRARGLAQVIADAYGRDSSALLVEVPEGLSPADERGLVAAGEWLAQHGHFTVWLAGAPLDAVDRVPAVRLTLPAYLVQLAVQTKARAAQPAAASRAVLRYPPISGIPRSDSPAERRLEKALAPCQWAQGRRWNYTFEWHLLAKPYRLDLFWPEEQLVVEVDGDDHRDPLKYADDRRRDRQLATLGHLVLRFTNDEVLGDVSEVVRTIERILTQRRVHNTQPSEVRHHVER